MPHFKNMIDQATRNARIAFEQGQCINDGFAFKGMAKRAAVANFESALEALQVAHMFAFTRITGEYWSGGKADTSARE